LQQALNGEIEYKCGQNYEYVFHYGQID